MQVKVQVLVIVLVLSMVWLARLVWKESSLVVVVVVLCAEVVEAQTLARVSKLANLNGQQ